MRMHFLHKPEDFDGAPLGPRGGLFASHDGEDVFVLGAFERRGVKLANVVPLKASARDGPPTWTTKFADVLTLAEIDGFLVNTEELEYGGHPGDLKEQDPDVPTHRGGTWPCEGHLLGISTGGQSVTQ